LAVGYTKLGLLQYNRAYVFDPSCILFFKITTNLVCFWTLLFPLDQLESLDKIEMIIIHSLSDNFLLSGTPLLIFRV